MRTQLFLSTMGFGIAFAVWGCLGGAAPLLTESFGLTPFETSLLVAIPVILGSLGRIPAGFLTDRLGTRLMMSSTLAFSGTCAFAIAAFDLNYGVLLLLGALMGISGTTFAIGVAHVSSWFPRRKQGSALGLFGIGNIGQSLAVFGIPWLALIGSWKIGFLFLGSLSLGWAMVYWLSARESQIKCSEQKTLREMLPLFTDAPMAWILSTYYFLTFGGFVAMSVYLPTLLKDQFLLTPQEAGVKTAAFVLLATSMRAFGGYLSDRFSAARILFFIFFSLTVSSLLLMTHKMELFQIGVVVFAIACGTGNGAVFKMVPHYFPNHTGTAAGLIGAAGGMGGFFPPLLMGFSLQHYGHYLLGWMGLLIFSLVCMFVLWKTTSGERKPIVSLQVEAAEGPGPF